MSTIPHEAAEWLTACLDPYHDNQLRLEGLPDMISAPSVVKMHNQSYTLTAPSVAAGGDWDATVAFTGCNSTIGSLPGLLTANTLMGLAYDHGSLSTGLPFGSFVCKAGAAGVDLVWGAPCNVGETHVAFGASDQAAAGDRCRIIAVAFEITNTTAEIYKQGSITTAMLPSAVSDFGMAYYRDTNVAPWALKEYQSWFAPKFAANRNALLGVPGSCTWMARDGLYAIPRLTTQTMPLELPTSSKRAAVVMDSSSAVNSGITVPSSNMGVAGVVIPTFYGVSPSGFNGLQAFLTGLSPETSLTITMRSIVEYFPSFGSELLMLTTPSTAFAPQAFELYSKTVRIAPYAVPVDQNTAGEYFRKIMRIASSIGSALAPMAGNFAPVVSAAATGVGALERAWTAAAVKKDKQKLAKQMTVNRAKTIARRGAGAMAFPTRR